jgi:HEAT repeat protein
MNNEYRNIIITTAVGTAVGLLGLMKSDDEVFWTFPAKASKSTMRKIMRVVMLSLVAVVIAGCESPEDKASKLVAQMIATPNKQSLAKADEELTRLGPAALPAMIDALGEDNRFVGMWLLEPILATGESAVLPLATALADADVDRRRWALFAISGLASRGIDVSPAVPAILKCTHDTDAEIRGLSLMAISSAQSDRGVPQLVSALNDPEAKVRSEAAKTLGIIASVRVPGALLHESPLPQVSSDVLAEVRPVLTAALSDESVIVRRDVAEALGEYGPSVEPALQQPLKDSDADVRAAALKSLTCIRSDGAVAELIDGLNDPSAPVRFQAARWLGLLADPDTLVLSRLRPPPLPEIEPQAISSAIPALNAASNDNDPGVRKAATDALVAIRRDSTKGKKKP